MVYTLQLINADTNKVAKEVEYDDPDVILKLLHMAQTGVGKDCYFTDYEFVGLKSEYISNNVIDTDNGRIYQLFFKFELDKVRVI